ncbi:Caspase-1, p20 [Roseobacter sp. SK209-2-6]|uniref:caspase family protein n=1 Tax=Roseobacter sp. SK209-2-6 TaxID=388739 RepID=UPI0000F3C605|nr:caspase family protein [Roseobacter sp. SK209-2-6]EBA18639.1 Caspase-1, p20 [Roseobacter sp. SK209-2-6]
MGKLKPLLTIAIMASLALSRPAAADVGDFAAGAIIGGIIGGAITKGNNRKRQTTTRRRSRLPSTQEGKAIQGGLNYFGFNAGTVDGQLGRKSRNAISQYQAYLGYPVTGQLNEFERELLFSSHQRALASGYLATQQAMSHPDGPKGLLRIYLQERMALQQQQQGYNQLPATTMVNNQGAQAGTNAYGAPQQYSQVVPQPGVQHQGGVVTTYGAAQNVQVYGGQVQGQVQGQYQQQGQVYQPQGQVYQQGQVPQVPQQGQVYQQGQVPQQGQAYQQQQVLQGQVMASVQGQQQQNLALQAGGAAVSQAALQQDPAIAPPLRRRALVIGVDGYQNLDALQKARNDAQAISTTLVGLGFDVTTLYDVGRRDINGAVSTFSNQIEPGDEVLFYFAGHGVEVDGRNYLLPADVPMVNFGDETYLTGESIAADRILNTFQRRGARSTVMILDACRNNPFPRDGQRSVGGSRGLVRMEPPKGAFILYSAGAGQTALDRLSDQDANPNSVFTRALLQRLNEPGMSLHELAKLVRRDVQKLASTVNHDQFPSYYDQMSGELILSQN